MTKTTAISSLTRSDDERDDVEETANDAVTRAFSELKEPEKGTREVLIELKKFIEEIKKEIKENFEELKKEIKKSNEELKKELKKGIKENFEELKKEIKKSNEELKKEIKKNFEELKKYIASLSYKESSIAYTNMELGRIEIGRLKMAGLMIDTPILEGKVFILVEGQAATSNGMYK